MLQRGGELDLLQEPLGAQHGGELGMQDLERDPAAVPNVFGEVDGRHPALTQLTLDAVTVRESARESVDQVCRTMPHAPRKGRNRSGRQRLSQDAVRGPGRIPAALLSVIHCHRRAACQYPFANPYPRGSVTPRHRPPSR